MNFKYKHILYFLLLFPNFSVDLIYSISPSQEFLFSLFGSSFDIPGRPRVFVRSNYMLFIGDSESSCGMVTSMEIYRTIRNTTWYHFLMYQDSPSTILPLQDPIQHTKNDELKVFELFCYYFAAVKFRFSSLQRRWGRWWRTNQLFGMQIKIGHWSIFFSSTIFRIMFFFWVWFHGIDVFALNYRSILLSREIFIFLLCLNIYKPHLLCIWVFCFCID